MTMHAIEDMPHMFSPANGEPLYAAWQLKAAYAAGMERAAEICEQKRPRAGMGYVFAGAIRAEIKERP